MATEVDPARRAAQKVQTQNNIIEAGLRRHLAVLRRQCEVSLSHIDQDRLDVRDFLKQLKRCTTDDLPEAKQMQRAQKMNNIVEASMRRQLEQYERQRDNIITLIDQDRLDIHDFLKNLKKCPSEELPETRHWLGNRTPSGNRIPRTTRLTFRNQSAPTSAEQEAAAREAELLRQEHAREYEMLGFRSSRPKPELVQRTMALHKLFSKRNLYAGMGHAWDAWGMTGFNGPVLHDLDLGDSDLGLRTRTPEESGRARRDQETPQRSTNGKPEVRHDCGRPGCSGHQSRDDDDDDFMKELVVGKHRKKRKKKEPLQERINGFFDRMDVIKQEERRRAAKPSQVEMHRRWVALTRGAKAALAESSDEEDANPLHTL